MASREVADEMARQFRFNTRSGEIETDFPNWSAMRDKFLAICKNHDRETIAASVQKIAEDMTVQSVRWWLEKTRAKKLALAGGLFANVRLNRLLAETLPVDEVFIFPAMGDDGLSVGSALTFLHARDGTDTWLRHRRRLDDVYLGQNFDGRIDDTLASAGMRRLAGRPVETSVDLIRAGKAGAIYTGRMEFGPRALGARSIIGSPHDHAINDSLNKRLSRSEFMPFAPFVLEEDAARVFEITDVNRYAAHFMTITCGVKPEWRAHPRGGACRRHRASADRARRGQSFVRRHSAPLPRPDRTAGADQHLVQRARGADRQPAGGMPAGAQRGSRRLRRDPAGSLCAGVAAPPSW